MSQTEAAKTLQLINLLWQLKNLSFLLNFCLRNLHKENLNFLDLIERYGWWNRIITSSAAKPCLSRRKSRFILSLNKYLEPNREKPSNQDLAQIASTGLSTNQASIDVLDCDVFSDIFLAAHPLFLENTPESNGNCVGVASTVQNFEGWPEPQSESFTTYPQQHIPEPSATTSTLQPTDTLQVMCTYSTPRHLPTEHVSWAVETTLKGKICQKSFLFPKTNIRITF